MGILDAITNAARSPWAQEASHALAQIGYAFGKQPLYAAREAEFLDSLRSKERLEAAMREAGYDPDDPSSWTAEGLLPALVKSGAVTMDDVAKSLVWKLEEQRMKKETQRLAEEASKLQREQFEFNKGVTEKKLGPEIEHLMAQAEKERAYADFLRRRGLGGEGGGGGAGGDLKATNAIALFKHYTSTLEKVRDDETLPLGVRQEAGSLLNDLNRNVLAGLSSGNVDVTTLVGYMNQSIDKLGTNLAVAEVFKGPKGHAAYDPDTGSYVVLTPLGTFTVPGAAVEAVAGKTGKLEDLQKMWRPHEAKKASKETPFPASSSGSNYILDVADALGTGGTGQPPNLGGLIDELGKRTIKGVDELLYWLNKADIGSMY